MPIGAPLPDGAIVEKAEDKRDADVAKRPPKPSTLMTAGQCLESGGDKAEGPQKQTQYGQAALAYQQALEQDPKLTSAMLKLARVHEKMGQLPQAEGRYQEILSKNPNDAALWSEFGMFQARQKRFDRSVEYFAKAASLEPGNPVYANHLGFGLARAGRFDESLEHFSKTVGPARAHYNLARMTRHMGREDLAQQHLQTALQIDPQFADARRMLEPQAESTGDPAIVQVQNEEVSVVTP